VASDPNMCRSLGKAFNHESADKGMAIEWSMTLLVEHQIQIYTIPNPKNFALVQLHYRYSLIVRLRVEQFLVERSTENTDKNSLGNR